MSFLRRVKRLTVGLIESFKVIGIDNAEVNKSYSPLLAGVRFNGSREDHRAIGDVGKEPRETKTLEEVRDA